ncbi:MAG: hypothetical protein R3267_10075 [Paenisporosarcina sp.]|nr:hypothetical protein [Paenisporosarcina sp.]
MSFLFRALKTMEKSLKETERENRHYNEIERRKEVHWHKLEPYFNEAWKHGVKVVDGTKNKPFSTLLEDYKEAKSKYASFNSFIGFDGILVNFPTEVLEQIVDLENMYDELDIQFRMFFK